jgi:TolA-binding protein
MIEMILFSAPALLAGLLVGTAMGWKIGKFSQKPLGAEVERLKTLTQQQAKQIWNQADRIHELEIDKLQLTSWQRSEAQNSEAQRSEAQPSGNTRPIQVLEGQRRPAIA